MYPLIENCENLEEGIARVFGTGAGLSSSTPIGGGCINQCSCLELTDGKKLFCKKNGMELSGMFHAEAQGLLAMRRVSQRVDGPRIPEPIALLQGQGYQYLLLEWISPGRQGSASLLGEQLARFHAAGVGAEELPCVDGQYSDRQGWGFPFDNFIGRTPQINSWRGSWAEFFGDCRLGYLVGLLKKAGLADKTMLVLWDKLRKHLAEYLPEPEDASLLHGDLWSGNYMTDQSGQPVLYDPAVYVGDHEADLAMMQLFGNPVPAFWEAYRANFKLDKEYPRRREIYNLYHLMNHLLLFGRGYHSAVIHSLHGILDRPVIFP